MDRVAFFLVALIVSVSASVNESAQRSPGGRVIGGQEVSIEQFPHLVSIKILGAHRCGGSIIKSNTVLTAAHCVDDVYLEFLKIVAGTSSRTKGGISLGTNHVVVHENYVAENFENDIALVFLNGHFEYSTTVQPITLARANLNFRQGTKGSITGWGVVKEGDHLLPVDLRSVDVYAVKFDECVEAYKGVNTVSSGMICTYSPLKGRDSCQGDAGSPLMMGNIQVGIISWGQGCARVEYPRVHTSIAYYRAWIDNLI